MGDTIKLAQYLGVVEAVVAILEVTATPVGPVIAAKGRASKGKLREFLSTLLGRTTIC